MLKKSVYLFILCFTISAFSMEKDVFHDAIDPEENIQVPECGGNNFTGKRHALSKTNEIVNKDKRQLNRYTQLSSIQDLPTEIVLRILTTLTNAPTPKEAVQSIINFSRVDKIHGQFVKFFLPGLLTTIIGENKIFTVKEFLNTGLFPVILIEAFETYFRKKDFNQVRKKVENFINDIKTNIAAGFLSKENTFILLNLDFLNLLTDNDKIILLFAAAFKGSIRAIEALLSIGTNPNMRSELKFDATDLFQVDHNKFYTYFNKPTSLTAYDEPNIMCGFFDCGYTPLMLTTINHEIPFDKKLQIIRILLDLNEPRREEDNTLKADINKQSKLKGHTALMLAVLKNDNEMVKFLLNNGADKDIRDYCGHTASQIAHEFGFETISDLLAKETQAVTDSEGKTWIALWTMLFDDISASQITECFWIRKFDE